MSINVKVKKLHENALFPSIGNPGDACLDLYSLEDVKFRPGEIKLVRTGIAIQLPPGHRAGLYVRSSTPIKKGFILANGEGIIDNGYRGELMIQLMNVAVKPFYLYESNNGHKEEEEGAIFTPNSLSRGDKIAQIEVKEFIQAHDVSLELVDELDTSVRGDGGFGSTGK